MSILRVVSANDERIEFKPKCIVNLGDTQETFVDFAVVGMDPTTGALSSRVYGDVITLGLAIQLLTKNYNDAYNELSPTDKKDVDDVLRGGISNG